MATREETLRALRVRRMIFELTGQRSRKRRRPPAQRPPAGAKLQYLKEIMGLQRDIEAAVRDIIFPNLEDLVVQSRIERPDSETRAVFDAAIDTIDKLVGGVRITLGQSLEPDELDMVANRAGQSVAGHNSREMNRIIQSTLGISPVTAEPWMASTMRAFRKENVNLIESLVGDELKQIENILVRGQRRGLRVEVLREQIEKRFSVSRSKATLLARDQTNKLNGELTGLRQTSLGITKYRWRNSGDERVRGNPDGLYPNAEPSHWDREGKIYDWDDPPEDGHPGEPIQCRCYAEPVLDDLVEAIEPVPTGAPLRFARVSPPVALAS